MCCCLVVWAAALLAANLLGEGASGEILGRVEDGSRSPVSNALVLARDLDTGAVHKVTTGPHGRFRFPPLPVGRYEVVVEKPGFTRHTQGPVLLGLDHALELVIRLRLASTAEMVRQVPDVTTAGASDAGASVGWTGDHLRELPLAPDHNVLRMALAAPGVSQLSRGQSELTSGGVGFAVNGARIRSNTFLIDGQDSNDPTVTGLAQTINNPDLVQDFSLVTRQFAAQYGGATGSVVTIVTKRGTSQYHGSLFWFHNNNRLNARSNLDKVPVGMPPRPKFERAPWRTENQVGATIGGPLRGQRTFWFGSLERWSDRQLNSGPTVRGVPTEQGRGLLAQLAGARPTVRVLLAHLPPAQTATEAYTAPVLIGGQAVRIPVGSLNGSNPLKLDNSQWSLRSDHRLGQKYWLGARYLFNDQLTSGAGQATPPGLTTVNPLRRQAAVAWLNSNFTSRTYGELRLSWQRLSLATLPADLRAEQVPSIEINELGLTGSNTATTRTALGLSVNLPVERRNNNYQLQYAAAWLREDHALKVGLDFRKQDMAGFFTSGTRGRLVYNTLQDFLDDVAQTASITLPLPGSERIQHYNCYDYLWFFQHEWRLGSRVAISSGVRFESPGNAFTRLRALNERILARAGAHPAYVLEPIPRRDTNNWGPRFGFVFRPAAASGWLGRLIGEEKLVFRGGYARAYDSPFWNIAVNVANSFPFWYVVTLPARTPGSLERIQALSGATAAVSDPWQAARTVVSPDFRSPFAEQFGVRLERAFGVEATFSAGYVATKGTALYQTIDGNPTLPENNARGTLRMNPARGVVRLRANATSSIYHGLQVGLERRWAKGLAFNAYYSWSAFIDGASDIFNTALTGEVAVAQDSYNRRADRARSSYDRPHRLSVNAIYESRWCSGRRGWRCKLLGGWQISPFIVLQSGAPFTVLDGADPGYRLSGIDGLVGNAIRASSNTKLDLARMSVEEIFLAGGPALFSRVSAQDPLGNLGRNVLRADGIADVDVALSKNFRIGEAGKLQLRAEVYRAANTRDFGIPESRLNSTNFLNQWGQEGGRRRVLLAIRYLF